ncbi:MAG: hypothetical protein JNM36_11575 [Chitinophagales bacterium]|nr:hypothetical protein [Chitinophagales bacterium]
MKCNFLMLLVWCWSLTLLAQDVEQRPHKDMTERLTQQLQLSPEQVSKVAAINAKFETQMQSLRQKDQQERDARQATREKTMDDHNQAIDQILTPEQRSKHQAMVSKMKERRAEHEKMRNNPEARAAKMTEKMASNLQLDAKQTEQLKAINNNWILQRHKLSEDTQLSPEAKRPKMKALHEQYEQKLKALLTQQQYQQHLTNREQHRNDHHPHGAKGKGNCMAPPPPPPPPAPPKPNYK